jgi:hypothetical protein
MGRDDGRSECHPVLSAFFVLQEEYKIKFTMGMV